MFGDSISGESNCSIRLVKYTVPKLWRNLAALQPQEFDFQLWASNASKLIPKPIRTFFPVNRSSIWSENKEISRTKILIKYGNFVTQSGIATAFSLQVRTPSFRDWTVGGQADSYFLSHQPNRILELSKFARHLKEYLIQVDEITLIPQTKFRVKFNTYKNLNHLRGASGFDCRIPFQSRNHHISVNNWNSSVTISKNFNLLSERQNALFDYRKCFRRIIVNSFSKCVPSEHTIPNTTN